MGVFHWPSLFGKSLSCRSYPGLRYGQSLLSLHSPWYGPSLLGLVCRLELMSVMGLFYPEGISWQFCKVKTPRTHWKVGNYYNFVHFLTRVMGISEQLFSIYFINASLLDAYFYTHRLATLHAIPPVHASILLKFVTWNCVFMNSFAHLFEYWRLRYFDTIRKV